MLWPTNMSKGTTKKGSTYNPKTAAPPKFKKYYYWINIRRRTGIPTINSDRYVTNEEDLGHRYQQLLVHLFVKNTKTVWGCIQNHITVATASVTYSYR